MAEEVVRLDEIKCSEERYRRPDCPLKLAIRQLRNHEHRRKHHLYSHGAYGGIHDIRFGIQEHWDRQLKIGQDVIGVRRIFAPLHLDCGYAQFIMREILHLPYSVEAEISFCLETALYVAEFFQKHVPGTSYDIYLHSHIDQNEIYRFDDNNFVRFQPAAD